MSKAFVKEDNDMDQENIFEFDIEAEDQDLLLDADGDEISNAGVKNYITQAGYDRLKENIHQLANIERPKMILASLAQTSEGVTFDDLEMRDAQRRVREIDRELRTLQRRFDAAEVVQPEAQSADRILFGATVSVIDEEEHTRVYRIVGAYETDAKLGKISWRSPIGQALLQAKVGDVVTLKLPHGEEDLEIAKIEYKPIP